MLPIVAVLLPPFVVNKTESPPLETWFPFPSFAVNVSVIVEPEATVDAETEVTEVKTEADAGVTVIVGMELVTAEPPIAALSVVAVPASTPVNVAV